MKKRERSKKRGRASTAWRALRAMAITVDQMKSRMVELEARVGALERHNPVVPLEEEDRPYDGKSFAWGMYQKAIERRGEAKENETAEEVEERFASQTRLRLQEARERYSRGKVRGDPYWWRGKRYGTNEPGGEGPLGGVGGPGSTP